MGTLSLPASAFALVAVLAASGPALAPEGGSPVTMNVLTGYNPAVVTLQAGGSVTWQNTDNLAHTVTSYLGGPPDSPTLLPGAFYTASFPSPGVSVYRCVFHPWMNGVVVVTP